MTKNQWKESFSPAYQCFGVAAFWHEGCSPKQRDQSSKLNTSLEPSVGMEAEGSAEGVLRGEAGT